MKKGARGANKTILRFSRNINNHVGDLEKLETLVVRLEDALREVKYETKVIQITTRSNEKEEDPFDKIAVA